MNTTEAHSAKLFNARHSWVMPAGAVLGGAALGVAAWLAEKGLLWLPRLEPLFAAPPGGPTFLFAVIGASLGGLVGGLATLERVATHQEPPMGARMNSPLRWLAWAVAVISAATLLGAVVYIWFLSAAYGTGSDQESRIGYTLKNVQRIPGDTSEEAAAALADIVGGERRDIPADPLAAAIVAPVAAHGNQTIVYGAAPGPSDLEALAEESLRLLADSPFAVVVSREEPAYALPASYAAAHFRAPVIPVAGDGGLPEALGTLLTEKPNMRLLIAAPTRLVSDERMRQLERYGAVERLADDNIYRHALKWAQARWGDFGWGITKRDGFDGYHYFTLANPENPAFAAAGLPMAYLGNSGPLLYTGMDDLADLTDQYLWRLGPEFFVAPSDGPFMNVRIIGGPDSVSYKAQARADLALETHDYQNEVTGMSGLAVLGWAWFFIGLAGAVWVLFAMSARLPHSGFYPRLYWPLAVLILGPVGILAFLACYQSRPIHAIEGMARFERPSWAQALSGTVMSIGPGMAFMIGTMYLFQLFGLPLFTGLSSSWVFWLGSPMGGVMWLVMVPPAILISTLFYMGPMKAEMGARGYLSGALRAAPVVSISMVAASLGMFWTASLFMNLLGLRASEDLWLWVPIIWWSAAAGFVTAYIPNYLMVKAGWKDGGM